jgi:hypothetical protein
VGCDEITSRECSCKMSTSGVWQNAPGLIIIAFAIAGIGALPYGVHRLYYGEPRKVGRDRWDFEMDKRDVRLIEARKMRQRTAEALAKALQEEE